MPRKTRKQLIGRFEAAGVAARQRELKRLSLQFKAIRREQRRQMTAASDEAEAGDGASPA